MLVNWQGWGTNYTATVTHVHGVKGNSTYDILYDVDGSPESGVALGLIAALPEHMQHNEAFAEELMEYFRDVTTCADCHDPTTPEVSPMPQLTQCMTEIPDFKELARLALSATTDPQQTDFDLDNYCSYSEGCGTCDSSRDCYGTVVLGDLNTWDTSGITSFYYDFYQNEAFDQNINGWNTSAATNMQQMFLKASTFDQNLNNWATGAVANMFSMFRWAAAFNQNIRGWDTGAVTNMVSMFGNAVSFNQNINKWDTGAVTGMENMFSYAAAFDQNINNWDTRAVTSMGSMFLGANALMTADKRPRCDETTCTT